MKSFDESYDCVVIGGGPAGATVATLLADFGHRTLVLERSHFPRHHIGESLMPQTYFTFERLGMLEQLKASDFPRKESVQFVSASGQDSQPYYFTDRDPNEWSITWQVRRDRFDKMMLDNAKAHGAAVREGAQVREVLFERSRAVGVRVIQDDVETQIGATVVVDATGTSGLLSRQLSIREPDPVLKNAAIYAYYENEKRDPDRNAGATIIIHTADRSGWFWSIPLPNNTSSIGLVAPPSQLFSGRGDDPLMTLEEEIALCEGIGRRLVGARRISGAYVTTDFSYGSREVAGDGWVLVGDAFGFLDPVYSSGVFVALKSGEFAADAIHDALVTSDPSSAKLGVFGPRLRSGIHLIRQLVVAFYDPTFSFGRFSAAHPECRDHIVRLLIGDIFNDEVGAVFDVMRDWVPALSSMQRDGSPTV